MAYEFRDIEKKWQKRWTDLQTFVVKEDPNKKKFYVVEMYPYPSGTGLHIGHAFNYFLGDVLARYKKMQGFNVLHPMGYDSFGLPAENAAINAKSHPKKFTDDAIAMFIKQQMALGLSYDWSRELECHDPAYYKWDQWIFLKMLEKGMAYRKKAPVNYCPSCKTVLSNEQAQGGICDRCKTNVQIKHLEQWFLKITDYADEIYEDTKKLDWPERVRVMQENWIGKSEGSEIVFEINKKPWKVFTTRPDTLFGVTFMVVSAQHSELDLLVTKEQKKDVDKLLKKIKSTKQEDVDKLDKEGIFSGSYAIHPLTKKKIPIWVGNFVLAEYGSGMVMGVPAHDQRDFDFAKKYDLEIKEVISGGDVNKEPYLGVGNLVNSEGFNDLNSREAKEHITKALETKKLGKKTIQYKLRDWLISRQRFWGTPIPIIYCNKCGAVPVREKDLPVLLPDDIKFTSEKNPLVDYKPFTDVKCPKCNGKGKRETDTMDTFVNSSWYFMRYTDSKNSKKIFDKKKVEYWMPMDFYTGGIEHACLHLIYSRFYTRFLGDLGLIDKKIKEPAKVLFNQGMVHAEDGRKMSKSLGNVIDPLDIVRKYGADSLRFFLVSVASPDSSFAWSSRGIEGTHRFLNKSFESFLRIKIGKSNSRVESKINKTIKDITKDIEYLRYNLATIKIRSLFDYIFDKEISKKDLESCLKLISPFCPHFSEEIWEKIKGKGFISEAKWPSFDEKKINQQFEKEEEAFEKLVGDINNVFELIKEKEKKKLTKVYVYVLPSEKEFYENKISEVEKRTGLKPKVFAVNDKNIHDPEGKSKKVKPMRPGIYLE